MPEQNTPDSAQVFMTKSVWIPFTTWIVTKFGSELALELTAEDSTMLASALAAVMVIAVRTITTRPAHLVKPKGDQNEGN